MFKRGYVTIQSVTEIDIIGVINTPLDLMAFEPLSDFILCVHLSLLF